MVERIAYDEFGLFADNAAEFGIPYDGPPTVRRESVAVDASRHLSALVWGSAPPELVFLHGGAQNAHTWDTVALALDRPLVAIDLPGHGHSDGGKEGQLDLADNAADVAVVIRELAPGARAVIGMSLGGLTTIALAQLAPELVRAIVLVDVTPGVTAEKAKAITDFVNGPASFPSFDELLKRTMEHNPTRSEASLRRGILHNAEQRDDGSWVWRYARHRQLGPGAEQAERPITDRSDLWDVIAGLTVPVLLVRGMRPQSVVDDGDEEELLRRLPAARVVHVEEAGHSVQGDTPVELARIIADFVP
jgi:pimeloyl-ACP methyl ester carboxylesterase